MPIIFDFCSSISVLTVKNAQFFIEITNANKRKQADSTVGFVL